MPPSLTAILLAVMSVLVPAAPAEAGFENPIFDKMLRAPEMPQEPRTVPAAPSQAAAPAPPPPAAQAPGAGQIRSVSSTAYCLTGTMASGRRVYWGAVAMNGVPLGSRWAVLSGPWAGRVLTVEDRIGHGSGFDVAMPGSCGAARSYGRRAIQVRRVS
jgi:hypothetical protein